MSKTKTKNNKTKSNRGRRSMKGKWGKVGAPPKTTTFPNGAFTMATLFNRNKNQCELSIRNKVDAKLADGSLLQLKSRKQAGGKVGRPKAVFVLKENFNATEHELFVPKAKDTTAPVVNVTEPAAPAPVVSEVTEAVAAVPTPPVETVSQPEVSAPVETTANVIPAPTQPETPAPAPLQEAA